MLRQLHPNVKIRLMVNFFTRVAYMMVTPFIAVYFSQRVGAAQTGVMFVCVILCGVLGGIVGGFYGDRIGRRKLMLLGEGAMVTCFLVIACLNSPWLDAPYATFVVFLVDLFFEGMLGPAAQALLIDSSTSETRRLIFQIQYWCGNLSMAIGSMIGAFLFQAHHFFLFLLVAAVTLFSFFVTLFFIKDTFRPEKKVAPDQMAVERRGFLKNYAFIIKDRIFMFYILATLAMLIVMSQLTNYIGVRLAREVPSQPFFFGLEVDGVRLLGMLQSENTLLVVFGTFIMAWLIKKINNQLAICMGVLIFTLGNIYLMFGTIPGVLLAAMLVATIGELIFMPVKQAYLADIAPEHARSSYMAASGMSEFFAMIIAGLMITIGAFVSSQLMAGVIALLGIGAAVCFTLSGRLLHKKQHLADKEAKAGLPKNA
ncbi:MFS transporter [Camelliibacillus cellulosilyticus]|uniref:MFS transporter n=1 Tax=Camelliibacillus cellulosilyticus TaxID=2174486 RepID=A0ABV9GKI3_9BACL